MKIRNLPNDLILYTLSFMGYKTEMDKVINILRRPNVCACNMCEYGTKWKLPITWENSPVELYSWEHCCSGCGAPFSFSCTAQMNKLRCHKCCEIDKLFAEKYNDNDVKMRLYTGSRARMYLYLHTEIKQSADDIKQSDYSLIF